ncbi:glycosyl hydrolase [Roseivirga sp. BDSF3-8]|uniref:VPS10 domain-containing protein n=1 Tax=Roseivirga sp. BDSF3-8 TaxID=3241598 RepID=UPI00353231E0
MTKTIPRLLFLLILVVLALPWEADAQRRRSKQATSDFNEKLYDALEWRNIGPYRGGRSAAVTGVPGKPNLYYFGSTGGGVWRTRDGGSSWENISDGYFGGSIGAVSVAESDPNTIYVGGGEVTVRGNVSHGSGMWKSVDAGKTWEQIGLEKSRHIPRVRIHPDNPDLVYAAVLGDLYKSSEQRGVYRSKDGGETWERVLFANADAGAVDLIMDPGNPRVLYASTWNVRRTPYSLSSGGEGSALWKSTDGGDTWTNLSEKKGMPKGTLGIIGVTVSPLNSERVWAIIEANEGGVFRSDDGGETWARTNDDRALRQRAWYYSRIYADTQDEDVVYVMNVAYHRSDDGGRTFKSFYSPHSDHHDLWIAPEDNQRMIIGDDGGAQTSYDGGANWSTYMNQPTAQFYRVTTDNHFPYRILGAQQDNSTVRIAHRTDAGNIGMRDWEPSAGGESAHLAVDPENDEIVYGGSYGGLLTRLDHSTGQMRVINVWPDDPMGHGAEGMKYRFQWNFPLFFSPHNKDKLYAGSNHLHVTTDEGQSWKVISPDLTRNDSSKLGPSGGPITKDNTGVEYYATIFAAVESPYEEGLIWTGSDDGLIHVTRDGGENWENVTPSDMPKWLMINSIDPDPFTKGGAYVAGTLYKEGDFRPYLYKTKDYGKTWTKIVNGIKSEHFTRVVRADPGKQGLLYAGTENGMYISFDDGASWKPFQLNLPMVPITDLALKDNNLIAATQGRSFWIIDDVTPLHQLNNEVAGMDMYLYKPMDSWRMDGGGGGWGGGPSKTEGENHPGGVLVHYYMDEEPDSANAVTLKFLDSSGKLVRSYSTDAKEKQEMLDVKKGANRFVWDMKYGPAKGFDGMILWWASLGGPTVLPGEYTVRLVHGADSLQQSFTLKKDPRSEASQQDLQAQFDFLMKLRDKVTETHEAIADMREVKGQISSLLNRLEGQENMQAVIDSGKAINERLTEIEKTLYQTKNRSNQDPLNYPIRLSNKLAHLNSLTSIGDYRPTDQTMEFYDEVSGKIDAELADFREILREDIPEFNQMVRDNEVDAIIVDQEETSRP